MAVLNGNLIIRDTVTILSMEKQKVSNIKA